MASSVAAIQASKWGRGSCLTRKRRCGRVVIAADVRGCAFRSPIAGIRREYLQLASIRRVAEQQEDRGKQGSVADYCGKVGCPPH